MAADQQIEGLFSQGTFSSSPASRNSWSTGVLHRILAWLPEWVVCMNRIVPIVAADTGYHTKHPGYTCSRSALRAARNSCSKMLKNRSWKASTHLLGAPPCFRPHPYF